MFFFTTAYLISMKEFDGERTSQATTGNGPVNIFPTSTYYNIIIPCLQRLKLLLSIVLCQILYSTEPPRSLFAVERCQDCKYLTLSQ